MKLKKIYLIKDVLFKRSKGKNKFKKFDDIPWNSYKNMLIQITLIKNEEDEYLFNPYTYNQGNMIGMLLAAVKNLNERIEELEKQIKN